MEPSKRLFKDVIYVFNIFRAICLGERFSGMCEGSLCLPSHVSRNSACFPV